MTPESAPRAIFSLLLSAVTLVVVAFASLVPLDRETRRVLDIADYVVCALFFFEFVLTLAQSTDRKRYLLTWGWIDLLSCIPAIDSLRWGRVALVMRLLRVLRAARSLRTILMFLRSKGAQSSLLGAGLVTLILLVAASIAVLHVEADIGNIKTAEDALWWSISTMTTVGYGDVFPTTNAGRLIAVVLMTVGVGLFATLSGAIAAWLVKHRRESRAVEELAALREEMRLLRAAVERRNGNVGEGN